MEVPYKLDKKDVQIIELLEENARISLTDISRKINLSVDAVHERIKKMITSGIIYTRALVDPRKIGYPIIADVKIKLYNTTQEDINHFIKYLTNHPRCIELISLMGTYDFTCVLIAKDADDLNAISSEIRNEFAHIISDWQGLLLLKNYKFEEYNVKELI